MVASTIRTPWGEELASDPQRVPLAHYPRPMLVRDEWECLNGWWDYAVFDEPQPRPRQWKNEGNAGATGTLGKSQPLHSGQIRVPFAIETELSGVGRPFEPTQTLVYQRNVTIPESWRGRRVVINFEAVDYEAAVWINDSLVTIHRGGYLPFSAQVPSCVGEEFRLRVVVRDPTDHGMQQRGKQSLKPGGIWYTSTSGIWQSVWMEPLPEQAITRVATRTGSDMQTLSVLVSTNAASQPVKIILRDRNFSEVVVHGETNRPCDIRVENPHPWTPHDPHLYSLTVVTDTDSVRSLCGLRTVAVAQGAPLNVAGGSSGDEDELAHAGHGETLSAETADERTDSAAGQRREEREHREQRKRKEQGADAGGALSHIELNGRPFLLNAPLNQGYWPESGMTAPSEDALAHDLQTLKKMGFNGVRTHIKVESRRFYALADQLGMVVVQDGVSGGRAPLGIRASGVVQATGLTMPDRGPLFLRRTGRYDAASRAEFLNDWIATIHHLEVHPSIIVWVPFNEGWGQFDARRVDKLTRRTDPTRLVDATSGWFDQGYSCGDFRSRHRYVLRLVAPPARDPRPFYLSEFAGLNYAVPGHTWDASPEYGYRFFASADEYVEALTELYCSQLVPLISAGLAACTYTQVSDVEAETNGLMTADRRVLKVDVATMRELNTQLAEAFARHRGGSEPSSTKCEEL
ncbi:sugar-binding domain-containing protein [Schaalia sp. ZJ1691]|uniref:glycoside hydrolase family 2 protein n=1 Tax=Schaalia sp. ZJ1691 TaxID=2709404 RepID=UPI0013EA7038|nr:sugar-binding domain-containing protein [Schaalia sp. ZJ1691]